MTLTFGYVSELLRGGARSSFFQVFAVPERSVSLARRKEAARLKKPHSRQAAKDSSKVQNSGPT